MRDCYGAFICEIVMVHLCTDMILIYGRSVSLLLNFCCLS